MSETTTEDAVQTSITAMTDNATETIQRDAPEREMPETPDQPDTDADAENGTEEETEEVSEGFTRKRMNQEVGTGIDQRGEVTVEVVKKSREEASDIMFNVFPLAVQYLRFYLDMADEEPIDANLEAIPVTENGWVRVRMWAKRGKGKDQRADTQTESVRVDARNALGDCVSEMRRDISMLKMSLGFTPEDE